jgi:transposase
MVDAVEQGGSGIRIKARTTAALVVCPSCGTASRRVHSRYERRIADGAIGGRAVEIRLVVRRLRCAEASCDRATFAEQVHGLTFRHGRRSLGIQALLRAVALQLAGRAGARLAERIGTAVSRSTLLRLIRATTISEMTTPRVLGVDDFALRKGHVYGTVLVDVESRRPVDLLPSREAEALAAWLKAHSGVEVICRDRATGYAEGARLGAPDAIHVADRWHVWHNLTEAVERVVARNAVYLREPAPPPPDPAQLALPAQREDTPVRLAARIRQRHAAVHALLAGGQTNAARLHEELTALGYRGGGSNLRDYLRPLRAGIPPRRPAPSVRKVTGWITRHPDKLSAREREELTTILNRCPDLAATAGHVRAFAVMMRERAGHRLNSWMRAVRRDALSELHSFVAGIEQDHVAVTAGLTMPFSSGVAEGDVNRIIMWNLICQPARLAVVSWAPGLRTG